jgi:methylated-DNA-[protein]-cysteine S-methyltransferase
MAMDGQRHAPAPAPDQRRDDRWFADIVEQLKDYFAGGLTRFDVPLELAGTDFQRRVWSELQRIPYGETISYGELARRLGQPAAVRAVGLANGRNPIAIVVPCHRVIGADGSLTGYGGGLERKAWLLDHEAAHHVSAA